jgi:hypothetical protein
MTTQKTAQIVVKENGLTFLNFFNSKEVYARELFDSKRIALNYAKKYGYTLVNEIPENIDIESILL